MFSDEALEADIQQLHVAIEEWATKRDIWGDCGFKNYLDHVGGEPTETPVASVMYISSWFYDAIIGRFDGEFYDLVRSHGFHYENANGWNLYFYPEEGPRRDAFASYFHWQWVCGLVRPDFADIYQELYSHFAQRPEDLHRLGWREFEVLLARVFQAQGFTVELGPGRGDGGVDIRLLQRDPIGDMLTLVQAKRYAPKNRIGLEAVAALVGVTGVEGAQRGLFVTTSSYQPAAKNFAARTSGRLELRSSSDVAEWCRSASEGIVQDKSTLVSRAFVEKLLLEQRTLAGSRIVHAHTGYGMRHNRYALILKETKHAALLMALPNQVVSDDGYGQRGTEIPALEASALSMLGRDTVWRASRSAYGNGDVRFWDGSALYSIWDGKPQSFDYYD